MEGTPGLQHWYIPSSVPVDWMHCVCEGILKRQVFNRWLNPNFAAESYSLVGFAVEVNEILLSIQVPHDCNRKPRSLDDLINTGKHQNFVYLFFLLGYLAFEMLFLAMNFQSIIALLTTALRKLHSVPLSKVCVEKSQVLLDNFVRLLPNLYGQQECTFNSHYLLHFPSQVLDNGSLSFTSAFVFEAFVAHLNNLYSGTRGSSKTNGRKTRI